jgi:hypothetical protein
MVHWNGDAIPTQARHQLGGLFDRLTTIIIRSNFSNSAAAPSADDSRTSFAETGGDTSAGAASRPSDHSHAPTQGIPIIR